MSLLLPLTTEDVVPLQDFSHAIDGNVSTVRDAPLPKHAPATARCNCAVGISFRFAACCSGRFVISPIPAGQYQLSIQKLGFRSVMSVVNVVTDDTLRLTVVMEPSAPLIGGVVVTGVSRSLRMSQFDRRRELGFGQFLTDVEIEKRNSTFSTELLRTFKGMNVKTYPGGGGQMQSFATTTRSGTTDEYKPRVPRGQADDTIKGCPMQVYVDGVPMPRPFNLDELPSPKNLAGVEIYSGPATTPSQFGGVDRRCGVIVV